VNDPQVSCERVNRRASLGGHDVPPEKISARWHRSLEQLQWFARRASVFWAYDNTDSSTENAPVLVARAINDELTILEPSNLPALTSALRKAWGLPTGC
jgi:predicted ABC-type ATPase